jgi:hypothetical protein
VAKGGKVAEDHRGDIEPWREQTAMEVAEGRRGDIGPLWIITRVFY